MFASGFIMCLCAGVLFGPQEEVRPQAAPKPAEESRLSAAVFRAGLKKRGLTELLELHLRDFPPADATEARLMLRDIKLAEAADPTRSQQERRAALTEANRALAQLIAESPADARRFAWRFDLARSLLFTEGEPYANNVLYRGGSPEDRRQLLSLAERAVETLVALAGELAGEFASMDQLSIEEFEHAQTEQRLQTLDELSPRVEYLLLWARLYAALGRNEGDPLRAHHLHQILELLQSRPALLQTPHAASHVQLQSCLLAGMAHRLLKNHQSAREHLDRALTVADGLQDVGNRSRLQWAIALAWIERVRNDAEDGRFDDALRKLERFRRLIEEDPATADFAFRFAAALLERSVYRLRAAAEEHAGRSPQATKFRSDAWQSLAKLAEREPKHRPDLYAALYNLIPSEPDSGVLDPLDQCAWIVGLLGEAQRAPDRAAELYARAVTVGERFLADSPESCPWLVPEVLFHLAVAYHRLGGQADAARRFYELARDYPWATQADQAAGDAVQLAARLHQDGAARPQHADEDLYAKSLDLLLTRYGHTETARLWRLHYAQFLEDRGDLLAAAEQYAQVDPAHEYYLQSLFFRARCLAAWIQQELTKDSAMSAPLQVAIDDFFQIQGGFVSRAAQFLQNEMDPGRSNRLRQWVATAEVLAAELCVLPQIDRAEQALETLAGLDEGADLATGLAARMWHVRIQAYARIGRLEDASQAVSRYLASGGLQAAAVLQALYQGCVGVLQQMDPFKAREAFHGKAQVALILAEQIHAWSLLPDCPWSPSERLHGKIQLAEAYLRTERYEKARDLFASMLVEGGTAAMELLGADPRIHFGYAESFFHLGEFAAALPHYNRLAVSLPPTDPLRWKSLLGDLKCRTALGHAPGGILSVIAQQKRLYPELGGPRPAVEFERLDQENQRRQSKEDRK